MTHEPTTTGPNKNVRVILPPDLYRRLRIAAAERDLPIGTLVIEAVVSHLTKTP